MTQTLETNPNSYYEAALMSLYTKARQTVNDKDDISRLQRGKKLGDQVFLSRNDTPYKDWRTAFRTAVRHAALTDVNFHDLRRTYISWLAVNADIKSLKDLARHKEISMTMRYAHLNQKLVRSIVAKTFDEPNKPKPWNTPKPRRSITLAN